MNDKSNSIFQHSLTWGVITGLVIIILSIVFYMTGMEESRTLQWLQILIIVVLIVVSQIQYKKQLEGESFSYGRALGVAMLTGVTASLLLAVYNFIFFTFIAPEMLEYIRQQAEIAIVEQDIPAAAKENALKMQGKFMKPSIMAVMSFLQLAFLTLAAGLLSSAFINGKTQKVQQTDTEDELTESEK
ncbi:MAG: DUF4199 domain-containing protein [Bacteroidota bacterium]